MNEEFAITLGIIFDNSSIERARSQLAAIQKEFSEKMNITSGVATQAGQRSAAGVSFEQGIQQATQYSARLELLSRQINEITRAIELANKVNANIAITGQEYEEFARMAEKYDLSDVLKLEAKLEDLIDKYNRMNGQRQQGNEETKKSVSLTQELNNATRNMVRNVKSLLLGVIGVQTAYAAIQRAMSAYLAQNDELQEKINACWYALGSLLAPVLEYIVNLFVKVVAYVDALVKALGFAGISMANYGKAAGKAAKQQKQLAGFDEINNLSKQDASGSGSGIGNPLADVEVKPGVVEFLGNLMEWLPTIIAGLKLIPYIIMTIIGVLKGVLDPVTAIKNIGIALAIFGIVTALNALYNYIKDPSWANFGMIFAGIGTAIIGFGLACGSTVAVIAGVITLILGLLATFWPQISAFLDKVKQGIGKLTDWIHTNITTSGGAFGAIVGAILEHVLDSVKAFIQLVQNLLDSLFRGVRKILDGIIQIFKGDFKGGIKTALDGIVTVVKGIFNSFVTWIGTGLTNILRLVTNMFNSMGSNVQSKIKTIINSYIINPVNKVISWINSKLNINSSGLTVFGKQIIPAFNVRLANLSTLPTLATGTNYVPNDMLAQIHQGEAVIPKEFNSEEYFNNEETNQLLQQLIDVVDSKEFKAYISQSEIGKASVSYINSQSRIMGESII